jgi:enterochelin esterase family protein
MLAGLVEEVKAGNCDALPRFWEKMEGQAPLVEPVVDDAAHRWVTFFWRGDESVRDVELQGGLLSRRPKRLARLAGTDLWFLTERLPVDTRLLYWLAVTQTMTRPADGDRPAQIVTAVATRTDPLNPRVFSGGSVLELPDAPPQPWVERQADVPQGELRDETLSSKILNEDRALTIYTPPGYDPNGEPCSLLVLFDGESANSAPAVLDNLVSRGAIPPTVAVMVHRQNTRVRDLACSSPFADFLATELVPWACDRYRASADPRRIIVSGLSLGGLMAGYCGLQHPEVFGNVLSQSGSFWYDPGWPDVADSHATDGGWLLRQFATRERLPLRFYMEIGWFEGPSILAYNRGLRAVLEAKGYRLTYTEFHGGHDTLTWRGSLADGLIALASTQKTPDS